MILDGVVCAVRQSMNPRAEAMKLRTKKFALEVLAFVDECQPRRLGDLRICTQLCDAATSLAANYRAACRARSRREFAAKIGVVLEEADESQFWLECGEARNLGCSDLRARLLQESTELTAIFTAANVTVRRSPWQ
jgi:four helix bundle protein